MLAQLSSCNFSRVWLVHVPQSMTAWPLMGVVAFSGSTAVAVLDWRRVDFPNKGKIQVVKRLNGRSTAPSKRLLRGHCKAEHITQTHRSTMRVSEPTTSCPSRRPVSRSGEFCNSFIRVLQTSSCRCSDYNNFSTFSERKKKALSETFLLRLSTDALVLKSWVQNR